MRRSLMGIAVASMSVLLGSVPLAARSAVADPGQVEPVSGPSPFAHCRPGEIDSTLPAGAFEPMAAVNPTDPENVVAVWAQDRFRGLVAGVSLDGGSTWRQVVIPGFTRCTGGRFDYVDDAWVSFGPDGVVHVYGKVFDSSMTPSGAFATRSTDGGRTWSRPTQLMLETTPGRRQLLRRCTGHRPRRRRRRLHDGAQVRGPRWRCGLLHAKRRRRQDLGRAA